MIYLTDEDIKDFKINIQKEKYLKYVNLKCSDCSRFNNDFACIGCNADDSAVHGDRLCSGFNLRCENIKDKFTMTQEENIFCAKRIMVDSIYKQANLEGIAVTFADIQSILNDINVVSLTPTEIGKIYCLRNGWHYLFDHIDDEVNLIFLEEIHKLTARFDVAYQYLGKMRTDDVMISGTDWRPEIPDIERIYEDLKALNKIECITDRAVSIGLYIMRTQMFKDGNKRVGSFAINKILIENGKGIFNVPLELVGIFKRKLVNYYESNDNRELKSWIVENCLDGLNEKFERK